MLVGASQAFQLMNADTLKIALNLPQLQEGKQEITLTKEMIKTPSNLTVVGIKPNRITVNASRFVSASVPIEVVTENELPEGLTIQKISVTPPYIRVLMPNKLYQSKIKIRTAPIDLKQITSTATLAPKLIIPPEIHFEEKGKQPSVKVVIRVRR